MHAIVTGGSSGIGLALVRLLLENGARVSALALDDADLAALAESPSHDGDLHLATVDVSDREAVESAVEVAVQTHGPCDLLVTSAGICRPGRFPELAEHDFDRAMEVNFLGTLWSARAVVPSMIERRTGSIVMISSLAGILGLYGYGAYGPSKFAVRGLAETLRMELRPHGVHVAVVFPSDVDTPMLTAENRLATPEMKALRGIANVLTPEHVARTILRGVERRKHAIYCDRSSALLARLVGAMPELARAVVDRTVARASR